MSTAEDFKTFWNLIADKMEMFPEDILYEFGFETNHLFDYEVDEDGNDNTYNWKDEIDSDFLGQYD